MGGQITAYCNYFTKLCLCINPHKQMMYKTNRRHKDTDLLSMLLFSEWAVIKEKIKKIREDKRGKIAAKNHPHFCLLFKGEI